MTDTLIPPRLDQRPKFHGMPIPYSVLIRSDGTPDFKATDLAKWYYAVEHLLCGLCGHQLGVHKFFIGGQKSLDSGVFFDLPMHKECAVYASQVCPYLVGSKGYTPVSVVRDENMEIIALPVENEGRALIIGMLHCTNFRVVQSPEGQHLLQVTEPVPYEVTITYANTQAMEQARGRTQGRDVDPVE